MAVKKNKVAYGVRVKLNENFEEKCLGDKYLKDEPVLFISYDGIYNDSKGEFVNVTGGSLTTSGRVYLDEMDLVFDVPEKPLYVLYDEINGYEEDGKSIKPTPFKEFYTPEEFDANLGL